MGGNLFADEKIVSGKFVVSLSAEANQKAWIVNALEQNIYNDLSGYGKIIPFKKVKYENDICINRDVDCILDIYKILKVDALMLGTVDNSDINYEIYDIHNKSLVKTGSIEIGSGSSLLKLRMGAFKAFKPFIEKGGILENKKYSDADEPKETNGQLDEYNSDDELKNQLLIFLAVFTCFPYLLSFFGKPLRHPERSKIVLRWFYPFQIVGLLLIAYQFHLGTVGNDHVFDIILNQFGGYNWVLTGLGGIFWGLFIIINFKIVMPHLQGIERIKPNNLFPLLQSCLLTIIIKTLIFSIFYLVFFYGIFHLGKIFSISHEVTVSLLFPIFGLYIFYWVALILDVFSMSLDVKLTGRKTDYNNVWNLKVRKYFIGYLKRNGLTLNKRLVEDIVFLPGENKGVVYYGGGLSRPRITIEKDLIKFTLGEVDEFNPEETGIFAKKVFEPILRQSSTFQIMANFSNQNSIKKTYKSKHDKKREKYIESMQEFFQRDLNLQENKNSERFDNITQGTVLPNLEGIADLPSLMSDNFYDMQVLEELLLENSFGTDRYDEDAEIDDSSEKDKDFLFGAILHKFGGILRHEDIFSTIYLYFRYKKGEKTKSYNFFFSKYFSIVSDTFVVLNFGLNHLMQHLYYQATNKSYLLTTKGITSRMLKSQDIILTRTKVETDERKTKSIQTDELDRIIWLSRFCQDSIEKQKQIKTRGKIFFKWSFTLGISYFVSLVFINSYNYHPKYIEIIEMEKQEIAEAIKNEQEKERKEK